tara:strand:+ start:2107 stop:4059 length:1953 start_codon:yes stop_codon:yes gene_type:complete
MSRELIEKELERRRGLDQSNAVQQQETITQQNLPTVDQQRQQQGAYGRMLDYDEMPEMNERSQAVADYLSSPEFGRLVLEVGGAVAGTAFAPQLTLPLYVGRAAAFVRPALQAVATRMTGAGLGEAGGAAVSQTFDPTEDVTKDLLRAFFTGATAEGAGTIINKGIAKAIGKNKKLIDGAEEAIATIEKQKQKILSTPKGTYSDRIMEAARTGKLTPALLQEGQTIDILENVADLSLIGGGSIRSAREGAESIATSGIEDFATRYKSLAGEEELGLLFQQTLAGSQKAFKATSNSKYKALDNALLKEGNPNAVDITNLKKWAKGELKNIGAKSESGALVSFLRGIDAEKNFVNFKKANNLRSDYLEITRALAEPGLGKKKQRLAAVAAKYIDESMTGAKLPDEVKNLYRNANNFYKKGAKVYNNDLFKTLMDKDPELVYKSIVPQAADRPTLVESTFKIIDEVKDKTVKNQLKNKLRGEFLEDILTKSSTQSDQFGRQINGTKFDDLLKIKKKKTFSAFFEPEQIKNLKDFSNALKFSQGRIRKRGGTPGAIFIQMKQSGAVMQLAAGGTAGALGSPGIAAGIILTPAALAKMMTNDKVIKYLTTGFKYNQNQTIAGRSFRQAIAAMASDGIISQDEKDKVLSDMKENGY